MLATPIVASSTGLGLGAAEALAPSKLHRQGTMFYFLLLLCAVVCPAYRAMDKSEKEERQKRAEQKRKEEEARRRWAWALYMHAVCL
jgi:hypothetical protein